MKSNPAFHTGVLHRDRAATPVRAHGARPPSAPQPRDIRGTFPGLPHFVSEYLLELPAGAAIALIWANTLAESYFRFAHGAAFWVNDVLMVVFFALIAKEVVEATAPGGVLHSPRRFVLPAIASLAMSVLPLVLYLAFIDAIDAPQLVRGWQAVLATDLALGYFILRVIFGRHPAIPFFLVLGIAANGLAFVAMALTDRTPNADLAVAIALMAISLSVASWLSLARVRSVWAYLVAAGGLSWTALYVGGLHPALALVPIVPFLPHAPRDPGFFVDAPKNAPDTLSRLERWCRLPAQVALFLFGLVNAGVPLRGLEEGTWALPLATLSGKPIGLAAGVAFGLGMGLYLPVRIGWREVVVIGLACGVGFTMALFVATSTMPPGQMLTETKMGAILSLTGLAAAYGAARLLRVGKFAA